MALRIRRKLLAVGVLALSGLAHGAPPATYLPGRLSDGNTSALVLVDPRSPAAAVTLGAGPGAQGDLTHTTIQTATFSPPSTYADRHHSTIVYVKDNRVYKASLLLADGFAPTQVSSEAEADRICYLVAEGYAAPGQSNVRVLYASSLPGGNCDPATSQWKLVRLNMGPGDAPVPARQPVGGVWDNQGRLTGWLGIDAGNVLKHYDADFGAGSVVATVSEVPQNLGTTEDGSVTLLRVDDTLRAYSPASRTLSGPLHAFATSVHAYSGFVQDSTHTYIVDIDVDFSNAAAASTRVLRVPSDGSAPATVLATETGSSAGLFPTANRIVYAINRTVPPALFATTFEVKSIAKTGGTPLVLVSGVDETRISRLAGVSASTVYIDVGTAGASTISAIRMNEDGTGSVTVPNARWLGLSGLATCQGASACNSWTDHILRVEGPGISGTSSAGTLKSISIGTNADVATLGSLPGSRAFYGYVYAGGVNYGSKALLGGNTLTSPLAYELYYYDANVAGSLVKVSGGGTAPPAATTSNAVEFYNAALDHYFITWVADEIGKLDAGTEIRGWTRTEQSIRVFTAAQAGASPVCRIYIPPGKGDGHFFGRDANECDGTMTKNPTFILEAPAFFHLYPPALGTCAPGTVPVYRVFSNRPDANHRYTTDRATRDLMQSRGWLAEGDGPDTVVMCAPA